MKRRVFLTGATGYLGSAIAARLVRAGHEVHGLTRRPEKAGALEAIGVRPVVGPLEDFASFEGPLRNADAVVHTAFEPGSAASTDQKALEAIRTAVQDGRVRRVLYTSGTWVYGDTHGEVIDEARALDPLPLVKWLAAHEEVATDLAEFEVDVIVLRPTVVYGESRGMLARWFAEARDRRTLTIPGTGEQYWPLVHRDDVAEAYALALEHGAGGQHYNLCDESTFTVRQMGEAVAQAAGAELRTSDPETLVKRLGAYGEALLASTRCSAVKARRELGWVPRHTNFVRDAAALYRDWLEGKEAPVV